MTYSLFGCIADDDRPLAFALKSGNFGGPDFFQRAVEMLA